MMKTTIVQDGGNTVTLQYSSLFPLPSAPPKQWLPNLRRGLLASITASLSLIAGISSTTATVPYEFSPTWGILTLAAWGTVAQLRQKK